MRTFVFAAAIVLVGAGAADAQPARPRASAPAASATTPVATPLPKLLAEAGYLHPDITAASCSRVSAKEVRCGIPAMTAGPYLIEASGTSTATGEGAVQAIDIRVGNAICEQARSKNTGEGSKPWTSGAQTIRVVCVVNFLTDEPMVVRATYDDTHATTSAGTPTLSFRRLPWAGMLSAAPMGRGIDQPKPAGQ